MPTKTLEGAIAISNDGRIVLDDSDLLAIEKKFVPQAAGTTNSGNCNDTSNDSNCVNEVRCRNSTNNSGCNNMNTCHHTIEK